VSPYQISSKSVKPLQREAMTTYRPPSWIYWTRNGRVHPATPYLLVFIVVQNLGEIGTVQFPHMGIPLP